MNSAQRARITYFLNSTTRYLLLMAAWIALPAWIAPTSWTVVQTQSVEQITAQVAETAVANLRGSETAPVFELDPSWPKPLPNNWALGTVWGVSVDMNDHIWVVHQTAGERYMKPITDAGKEPAPAVLESAPSCL